MLFEFSHDARKIGQSFGCLHAKHPLPVKADEIVNEPSVAGKVEFIAKAILGGSIAQIDVARAVPEYGRGSVPDGPHRRRAV
jgi:hypothetical protein